MCFRIIKHFYYFELDILCFLELKADNNNLCTTAFQIIQTVCIGQTVRFVPVIYSYRLVIDSQKEDNHLSDLNKLMNTFTP